MLKKILLLCLMPFMLCSCTERAQETVSFASWGSITETAIINKYINKFEAENPNIKINFIHIPQNYFQKIHLMFASKTPPDVIFINNLYLPVYGDYLEDLEKYIDKDSFYPQTLFGMSYNNKLLGVPRDISELVFYVNIDKVKLPQSNWTLDELLNICKNFKNDKTFCLSYDEGIYWALPYLRYFGGDILNENGNLALNSDKSKQALSLYKELVLKYHYAPQKSQIGSSTSAQMFLDGKIVFYLSGRWMYPKITEKADFNWSVINFPYGKKPQNCDVSGWAIAKQSKHKDAAIKFVKYMSEESTSEAFTKTGLIVPARKKASSLIDNGNHNEKIFIDIIDKSVPTNVNKDYKKITDKINKQLDL